MYYGIDLGTTNSAIAYLNKYGEPELIKNDFGNRITPSVVYIDKENTAIGTPALNSLEAFPEKTFRHIKNEMGKPAKFAGQYTPQELSAMILKKLVDEANNQTEKDCRDVVITVPASFDSDARKATEEAGKIAGLNVKRIISEPTAAAVAYGMAKQGNSAKNKEKYVLVYDLGGGTFDITLLKIRDNNFETIVTGGDRTLGGALWDKKLADFLLVEYNRQTKSNAAFADDKAMEITFELSAERLKKDLTAKTITMHGAAWGGKTARFTVSREKFDSLTSDLLQKTLDLTQKVIKEANKKCGVDVTKEDFDFLLVGGSSRMPQVKKKVKDLLIYEFNCNVEPKLTDPDECVAKGAAQIGDIIEKSSIPEKPSQTGKTIEPEVVFTDVASHTYGIEILDRFQNKVISNIIFANYQLPCEKTESFVTICKNQRTVFIDVYESDANKECINKDDARLLESSHTLQLPPNLPEGTKIQVCFKLDEQGMLHVSAWFDNDHKTEFDVEVKGTMTDEEIERSKKMVRKQVEKSN